MPRSAFALAGLALLLGLVTYLPFLTLPPLPDDYFQAELAKRYGPISAWRDLLADPLYRCRATSLIVTYWTQQWVGFSIAAFNVTSLVVHLINVCLVFLLGRLRWIGWRTSALAAMAFAVGERHHEAVVWYAALPELLVFGFLLLTLLLWAAWVDSETPKPLLWWASFLCFLLALASKESGVVAVALLALAAFPGKRGFRRSAWALVPFGLCALAYTAASFLGQQNNQHYQDGTFSLSAPFVSTAVLSVLRGLWFWGILGVGILIFAARNRFAICARCFVWMLVAMLPYSFLTYMPRIPSRHHYLAALGVALLIGFGGVVLWDRFRGRRLLVATLAAFVIHNAGYLWSSKLPQFAERARPMESLLSFMRNEPRRPVVLQCFPDKIEEVRRAVVIRLNGAADDVVSPLASSEKLVVYCFH